MSSYQNVANNKLYVNESPFVFWENETALFNVVWEGEGTLSSPTNTLYYRKVDKSSTQLSGSTTVSGRVQTTKLATLNTPGEWLLMCQVTDGSRTRKVGIRIMVKREGVE